MGNVPASVDSEGVSVRSKGSARIPNTVPDGSLSRKIKKSEIENDDPSMRITRQGGKHESEDDSFHVRMPKGSSRSSEEHAHSSRIKPSKSNNEESSLFRNFFDDKSSRDSESTKKRKVHFNKEVQVESAVDVENIPRSELYYSKNDFHRTKGEANLEAYYATYLEKHFSLRDLKTLLYQPYAENMLPICHVLIISDDEKVFFWLYQELRAVREGAASDGFKDFPLRCLIQLARNEDDCNDRFHSTVCTFDFIFVDESFPVELGSITDFMESVRENFTPEETLCVGICRDRRNESINQDAMKSLSIALGVDYVTVEQSSTIGTLWREICRRHYGPMLSKDAAQMLSLKTVRLPAKTIYHKRKSVAKPKRVPYRSIMRSLPHTLHEALLFSQDARAITETDYPFEIIHVNDAWAAQWGSEAEYIKDKPGRAMNKLHSNLFILNEF